MLLNLRPPNHGWLCHASPKLPAPARSPHRMLSQPTSSLAPSTCTRLRFNVVQGPFSLIPHLRGLKRLLGTSFWDVESALIGNEPDYTEPSNIVGSNLYGLQLVFQLFVAHLLSLGSTISIIVTTLPEEGHPKQVVAMASLQLKSAGPELVKAISCKRGAPVDAALDKFGVDEKEDVLQHSAARVSELHAEDGSGKGDLAGMHGNDSASFSVRESDEDIRFPGSAGIFSFQQEPVGIALMVYRDNLAAIRL
mmetsp:Transcript_24809/g.67595  ORF Transcript_24809/g.67595 Transcript_24809/m.67595 type:complete len:251 (+) Transcript_24809:138-890(+)